MYMHVKMHVSAYVDMSVCEYVWQMYNTYVYIHEYVAIPSDLSSPVCVSVCVFARARTHARAHNCMCACVCARVCGYVCVFIYSVHI